jgi:hypothetical protein
MMMGAIKRFWGRIQGEYASSGAANAYVLTPASALAAYATGERYSFRAHAVNTGAATLDVSGLGAKALKKMTATGKADLRAGDIQPGQPVTAEFDGTDLVLVTPVANTTDIAGLPQKAAPDSADFVALHDAASGTLRKSSAARIGRIAQVVIYETGAVATGTGIIPLDDTIPQSNEGDQYLAVSITPTSAASTLVVDVRLSLASSNTPAWLIAALFQDSSPNALATSVQFAANGNGAQTITFTHKMPAVTASATTFKVRAGANVAGTTTVNGTNTARLFGGTFSSSITVVEVVS